MDMVPRPEYPRPSWRRSEWLNLNGKWEFFIDRSERAPPETVVFDRFITVPFCPEARLSGIGETDFLNTVYYRRRVRLPDAWRGKRILLHFQAVDYDATVYIDGVETYFHRGCFSPFTVDLGTDCPAEFTVMLRARSLRDRNRPRGKQSELPENHHCCYTRTTGIWQTVWLEAVPEIYLKRPFTTPTTEGFSIVQPVSANRAGLRIRAEIGKAGRFFARGEVAADAGLMPILTLVLPEKERRFWSPEDPFLYDLVITLEDGAGNVIDRAESYAGWRFLAIDGMKFMLNGRPVFQKLVLDQGYYPDGVWTAPDDAALVCDIELAVAAGFNGARLHQKVFEERFLYHADRLGYLVWGEFGDWGVDWEQNNQPDAGLYQPAVSMTGQWLEAIRRDYSHPAIIGWCGVNETHRRTVGGVPTLDVIDDLTKAVFLAAKTADPTRPVLDVSGYIHRLTESDIYDSHDYGLPDEVAARLASYRIPCNCDPNPESPVNVPWQGQPFFLSEIGGIAWPPAAAADGTFSYGDAPQTEEEFLDRFGRLLAAIRRDKRVFGYCYTQLTDICQEVNGLYYFDRTPKFAPEKLRTLQQAVSEYEKNMAGEMR